MENKVMNLKERVEGSIGVLEGRKRKLNYYLKKKAKTKIACLIFSFLKITFAILKTKPTYVM